MSSATQNINDTFFKGIYKEVWKKLMPPALSAAECDFIQEIGDLKEGDKVLDIMCGHGRHALELARRGAVVTAIDNAEEYIKEIQTVAKAEALAVQAFASDVLNAELKDAFDIVVCMGNSFAFFNREDAITLLKKLSSHLKQGGIFIISSWVIAEIAIRHFREREWRHVDEYKYLIENKFVFQPSRIESEHTVIGPDGSSEVINGVDYIFTLSELEQMFQQAGLHTKALYATPRKKKFSIGDATIYIVAEKL